MEHWSVTGVDNTRGLEMQFDFDIQYDLHISYFSESENVEKHSWRKMHFELHVSTQMKLRAFLAVELSIKGFSL